MIRRLGKRAPGGDTSYELGRITNGSATQCSRITASCKPRPQALAHEHRRVSTPKQGSFVRQFCS